MNIVGHWSADLQYSPGAAADNCFAFFTDGKGYYAEYNWLLCGYETFEYKVEEGGNVLLSQNHTFRNNGHGLFVEDEEYLVGSRTIAAEIVDLESPVFGFIPFLVFLNFSIGSQTKFGRCEKTASTFELPYGVEKQP